MHQREKTPAEKGAATRKRNARKAAKAAEAAAPTTTPDQDFKDTIREQVQSSRVGFPFGTLDELRHGVKLIEELNAEETEPRYQIQQYPESLRIEVSKLP